MERIYLDHNATTAPAPEVVEAIERALRDYWGNPSSSHWFGQHARAMLDDAREKTAALINAEPGEIYFTSGGTESNNLAILGTVLARSGRGKTVITSAVEHPSVLHTVRTLLGQGYNVVEAPVNEKGRIEMDVFKKLMTDDVILVTVMAGNNESGTIQPFREIGELCEERGVLFHTDAVQCAGKIEIDVKDWPVDMLSLAGHKFYGPKGVGALWIKKGVRIPPRNLGGGQETGMRGGTENTPGIAGLGAAAHLARQNLPEWKKRITRPRDLLESEIIERVPHAHVSGDPEHRLPNTTNITFSGAEGEAIMLNLDLKGVAVSTGSACSSGQGGASHVLLAMGMTERQCESSIRFSLGKDNTEEQIKRAAGEVEAAVKKVRDISGED